MTIAPNLELEPFASGCERERDLSDLVRVKRSGQHYANAAKTLESHAADDTLTIATAALCRAATH